MTTFRKFLTAFFALSPVAFAHMDKELYEAVYEFEVKGNFYEAQDLLSRITVEGDEEDKTKAYFLLGKIQEVSENPQNAAFYYRQALANPANAREAYFLASRIAALDTSPEKLVIGQVHFSAPIRQTFSGKTPSILLSDNRIFSLYNEKFVSVPTFLPKDARILAVSPSGIYFTDSRKISLSFLPKDSREPVHTYTFMSEILHVMPVAGGAIVITEKNLALTGNDGLRFSVENRYRSCIPVGTYSPQNDLVLSCEDNALHLIDPESGNEKRTLSPIDPIHKVILSEQGIFVSSASTLWYYQPERSSGYVWKNSGNPIEDIALFEGGIIVLESGGKLKRFHAQNGHLLSEASIDGEKLFELSRGMLGIFSQEGALTAVDTAFKTLWTYHFGKPLAASPIKSQGQVFLPFENGELKTISALHYGMRPILSQEYADRAALEQERGNWLKSEALIDSAFALEPGNPTASYLYAVDLERIGADEQKRADAWAKAVQNSFGDRNAANSTLEHYAKIIGASYVRFLPLSPRTLYPNLFGSKHGLFTIDPAAQKLLALDPANGKIRWTKDLGLLETSPVLSSDQTHLALASGFRLGIWDLAANGQTFYSDLPGKPFLVQFSHGAIYVSTWNGYFIKLLSPSYRIAWVRKLFDVPFLFDLEAEKIAVASLEGSFGLVSEATGQNSKPFNAIKSGISAMELSDSLLAVATDQNEIQIFADSGTAPRHVISTDNAVVSLKWVQIGPLRYILAGFADQKIRLFGLNSSEPLWTYAGKGSIYTAPIVFGNSLFIDQNSYIAQISLAKGSLEKRFPTPGGAGTPFILDNTLFCTSPKRLLYAFPLTR